MAHRVIHSLREILAAFLHSTLHQRWAQSLLLCVDGPFWTLARRTSSREDRTSVASGGGADLRPGEEKLPMSQARPRHACDAARNRGRSQSRLTGMGLLWEVEHGIYPPGESHYPSWNSGVGSSHLGHLSTGSTAAGPPGVVAGVLSCCAASPIPPSGAHTAARTRRQTVGATLPTTDSCDGSGQNYSTMDDARGAFVPLAAGLRLRGTKTGDGCCVIVWGEG